MGIQCHLQILTRTTLQGQVHSDLEGISSQLTKLGHVLQLNTNRNHVWGAQLYHHI